MTVVLPKCLRCKKGVGLMLYRTWGGRHRACYFAAALDAFVDGVAMPHLPPSVRKVVSRVRRAS